MTTISPIRDAILPTCNLETDQNTDLRSQTCRLLDDAEIHEPFGKGERSIRSIRSLRHPKPRNARCGFQFDIHKERSVRGVHGDTLDRRARRGDAVLILLPRRNQKTTLGAASPTALAAETCPAGVDSHHSHGPRPSTARQRRRRKRGVTAEKCQSLPVQSDTASTGDVIVTFTR